MRSIWRWPFLSSCAFSWVCGSCRNRKKHVVERFGRLRAVLGPGINFVVPFLDRIAHKISILERQLPTAQQDAITTDNVLVKVETSVFYRITEPEKTVYRIRDVDAAIATTVAGDRAVGRSARWSWIRFSRTAPA
jgi:regulator of protease activity HflC (stomatin/prohibitin superfamily)